MSNPQVNTLDAATTKTCSQCFRERPISEFRKRWSDKELRHTQCRDCYRAEMRERAQAKRDRRIHAFTLQVTRAQRDPARVMALTAEMFTVMGGLKALAQSWKTAIDRASVAGRHAQVLRSYRAFFDLMAISDNMQPSPSDMSEEELLDSVRWHLIGMIKDQPEIALWAAMECPGWTVEPPPDAFDEDIETNEVAD